MTRRLSRLLTAAVAGVVLPLTLLAPPAALADPPPVLTGPDTSWSTTGTVADPHVQAVCAPEELEPLPVIEAECPRFQIVLDGDDARPLHYLDVTLQMTDLGTGRTVEDYDLLLLDANDVLVDDAASALGTREVMATNHVPDGTYTIVVVPYTNLPDSTFTLTARFRTTPS